MNSAHKGEISIFPISSLVNVKARKYLHWLACHFKVHKLHGNFIVLNDN